MAAGQHGGGLRRFPGPPEKDRFTKQALSAPGREHPSGIAWRWARHGYGNNTGAVFFLKQCCLFNGVPVVKADLITHSIENEPPRTGVNLDVSFIYNPFETRNNLSIDHLSHFSLRSLLKQAVGIVILNDFWSAFINLSDLGVAIETFRLSDLYGADAAVNLDPPRRCDALAVCEAMSFAMAASLL